MQGLIISIVVIKRPRIRGRSLIVQSVLIYLQYVGSTSSLFPKGYSPYGVYSVYVVSLRVLYRQLQQALIVPSRSPKVRCSYFRLKALLSLSRSVQVCVQQSSLYSLFTLDVFLPSYYITCFLILPQSFSFMFVASNVLPTDQSSEISRSGSPIRAYIRNFYSYYTYRPRT